MVGKNDKTSKKCKKCGVKWTKGPDGENRCICPYEKEIEEELRRRIDSRTDLQIIQEAEDQQPVASAMENQEEHAGEFSTRGATSCSAPPGNSVMPRGAEAEEEKAPDGGATGGEHSYIWMGPGEMEEGPQRRNLLETSNLRRSVRTRLLGGTVTPPM